MAQMSGMWGILNMKENEKIGMVCFSSYINGKLAFRIIGNLEHNDIIQRY